MQSDSNSPQTIATFTGTLLRREHATGQKFVQLVFREGAQNWLCVSSKLANAKLAIGQEYRIEGEFRQAGSRAYIHEPKIAPLRRTAKGASKPVGHKKTWVISASAFASLLLVGGVVFALHGNGSGQQLNAINAAAHSTQTSTTTSDTNTAADQQTPADTTDTATTTPPATTTPAATTTTKKTTTNTNTGSNSGTTSNPTSNVPASTAYCDGVVPIPIVYDGEPSDPVAAAQGSETGGTAGSTQTCYDDTAKDNPVITTVDMVHGTWNPPTS